VIKKVLSGGQTGADKAGWDEAKAHGIATGGCMPRGYMTESGPRPEYAETYGAHEHAQPTYPPRTRENVIEADGTVIFNFGQQASSGTTCTLGACHVNSRPVIVAKYLPGQGWDVTPAQVVDWVKANRVRTLNVAGNREVEGSTHVYDKVRLFLNVLFQLFEV